MEEIKIETTEIKSDGLKLDFYSYETVGDNAGDRFKEYDPDNYPKSCFTGHGAKYQDTFERMGWCSLPIFEFLWGKKKFDASVYYALSAFKPSSIRVLRFNEDLLTADSWLGRITVFLDKDDIINRIDYEVDVGLPRGIAHGNSLMMVLDGQTPVNSGVFVNPEALKRINFE